MNVGGSNVSSSRKSLFCDFSARNDDSMRIFLRKFRIESSFHAEKSAKDAIFWLEIDDRMTFFRAFRGRGDDFFHDFFKIFSKIHQIFLKFFIFFIKFNFFYQKINFFTQTINFFSSLHHFFHHCIIFLLNQSNFFHQTSTFFHHAWVFCIINSTFCVIIIIHRRHWRHFLSSLRHKSTPFWHHLTSLRGLFGPLKRADFDPQNPPFWPQKPRFWPKTRFWPKIGFWAILVPKSGFFLGPKTTGFASILRLGGRFHRFLTERKGTIFCKKNQCKSA